MVRLFIEVQSSGSGQFEQLYSQERETNIRLVEEIEQLKESLAQASLAGRTRIGHAIIPNSCICVCVYVAL